MTAYPSHYSTQENAVATPEETKEASCPNYLPGMMAHLSTIASAIMLVMAALSPQRSYPLLGTSVVAALNMDFYLYKKDVEVDISDVAIPSGLSLPTSAVLNFDLPESMKGTSLASLMFIAGAVFSLLCISIPMAFFARNLTGSKRYAYPIVLFITAGYTFVAMIITATISPSDTDIPPILIDQESAPLLPGNLSYGFVLLICAFFNIMTACAVSAAYIRSRSVAARLLQVATAGQPLMQQGAAVNV